MEDKRVGKSNRSKAICITVIVLLCIGLTGLFLMEYRSGNTNRKQKGSKNHTAEQTEQPIDWDSLQKVKLNHHKYGLLHKVTSWLIIGTDVSGNQDGIGEIIRVPWQILCYWSYLMRRIIPMECCSLTVIL